MNNGFGTMQILQQKDLYITFIHMKNESIYNKKFIITGMEEWGKDWLMLYIIWGKVIISVRSEHQLFEAKSYGYQIETIRKCYS